MASKAHAFFCFEVLSASFDDADYPDLQTVVHQYAGYNENERSKNEEEEQDDMKAAGADSQTNDDRHSLQIPSITRVQASTSGSGSASSTPSSTSVNSSTSQLIGTSTTDTPASASYASKLSAVTSYPMFVTWNVVSRSGNKSLRGCIGTFDALPLEKGLETYALTSAFEDTRFSPIPATLIPNLSCSLTLLADFEECSGPMDWELGKHGIRISFTHRYRKHGATYLPDVAVEQGWSQEETLESLMRKAGWDGGRKLLRGTTKPWEDVKDFKVVRYTGLKSSATYAEWQEYKDAVSSS